MDINVLRALTLVDAFAFGYIMSTKPGNKRFLVSTLFLVPIAVLNFEAGDGFSILFGIAMVIADIFYSRHYLYLFYAKKEHWEGLMGIDKGICRSVDTPSFIGHQTFVPVLYGFI